MYVLDCPQTIEQLIARLEVGGFEELRSDEPSPFERMPAHRCSKGDFPFSFEAGRLGRYREAGLPGGGSRFNSGKAGQPGGRRGGEVPGFLRLRRFLLA